MFKITAHTTDEQIRKATKGELIMTQFTGFLAGLRSHKLRTWTKAFAVEKGIKWRDTLLAEYNAKRKQ